MSLKEREDEWTANSYRAGVSIAPTTRDRLRAIESSSSHESKSSTAECAGRCAPIEQRLLGLL